MIMHMLLTAMEMCIMVACVPLYIMCPGMVFAVWTGCCAMMVMAMCWMLNGREMMHQCMSGSEGWMMGQENDDEKWMFMGGMGMSARHCHSTTLPMLSKLFSRPMTCICMPTYGLPFDMCMMMLQRCMPIPSSTRCTLYAQLRTALLDDATSRCVVLSHNHSAILLSQCVAMLCADMPADKLCKLEIYTFGSAACEFMMPLGESNMEPEPHHHPEMQTAGATDRKCIHVEHFAMMNDPFARMGVLQGVRSNMESRYCGGVFIMNNNMMMMPESMPMMMQMMQMPMACSGLMMEDYMMAMFPAQMMMMMMMGNTAPSTASAMPHSVFDAVMHIDRDCAEKREIAAMSSYHSASRMKKGGSGNSGSSKRLSWTGLATTAGHKNGISAGMVGLEMARKGCQNCAGHKGREVSWLSRYIGMMMGQGGMGMSMGMGMDTMKQAAMDGAAMARAP
ncbi:hypothetical protein B0T22DRAFT_501738 [Podospora appendiculata]|uniref:Uncharacterized protein n=1 Tax=Podospora appendiculata TaxID=314037 RepID=A0AAE0X0S2_9PEZI|nr:hypothetical protein B0T22DRAFT_501738 [Podospora appendiculata]